jgi:hypothetical protein
VPHSLSKGRSIIAKYKNLGQALLAAFPEFVWDVEKFSFVGKKSMQGWYEKEQKRYLRSWDNLF